ncbi:hypothetical protein Cabys_2442 [Caldithrix abyssi DSM 13497]|uniref:Uncharacterized protein n=1 Tax=Caldithrix abyssi DSM 13497 TaxID=880073 RepID=A0A1J1C963_CALAY|nr:hypothetical protein Cabys_2442 [Caldithrix abyssi DSM 13497]
MLQNIPLFCILKFLTAQYALTFKSKGGVLTKRNNPLIFT